MHSGAEPDPPPSAKPLRTLGRDEMNLCEFPITLLTDRIPKDQKEAVYQDVIYDERIGRALTRKLIIQAGNYGLTTAIDDEIILALIQITKRKNDFKERKVEFTRLELIELLGWANTGASYDRIKTSLNRWTSVYLLYENAWRDNSTKTWKTVGFHIIDKYELNDSRNAGDRLDMLPSYIVWGEDIFASFQAGYLKPLDYDLCMGLRNSTAKRMFRFLDKRFYHKPELTFDLKEFAHEHVGLSRNYEGQVQLRRKLQPGIAELERIGFLEPLPEAERFQQRDGRWTVRFIKQGAAQLALPGLEPPPESPGPASTPAAQPAPPPKPGAGGRQAAGNDASATPGPAQQLIDRGVTAAVARRLLNDHEPDLILKQIDAFDWRVETKDKHVQENPAGYLVRAIQHDYALPTGYLPKAERRRREEAERLAERQAAEGHRREREQEEDQRAARAYRAALTPTQLKELEAAALANASEESRRQYENINVPSYKQTMLFMLTLDHIRRHELHRRPGPASSAADP